MKIIDSNPITSCQIQGESRSSDTLYFLEIQNHSTWWMEPWNKKTLAPWKVRLVKAMVFPVVMYGCESWTVKKAEHWRIDAFELWCWRRLLRVPWTTRRANQSILKEINPEYSLKELILKLKLQYSSPPDVKSWLIGKDLDAGKDWRQKDKEAAENEMVG